MQLSPRIVRPLVLIAVLACALQTTGCGTLFTPNALDIQISSNPSGAEVFLNNKQIGRTPMPFVISPMESEKLEFKLDGYKTGRERIEPKFNWISLLDILFWPVFFVDIATGKIFKGEDVHVTLEPGFDEPSPVRPVRTVTRRPTQVAPPRSSGEHEAIVPPAGFNRISAAVLPIVPQQSASVDDAALLTDRLEQSIYEQGRYIYTLVDRTVVDQTIAEQGFQSSDYTEQSAAELGRMLNIEHVIVGTYTQSGDGSINSLGVRIIDVETNVIQARGTVYESSTAAMTRSVPATVHDLLTDFLDRAH